MTMDFDVTDCEPRRETDRRAEMNAIFDRSSPDEQTVLLRIARRIDRARPQYGPLDVANDRRDWGKERRQEIADLLVYIAIDDLARGDV